MDNFVNRERELRILNQQNPLVVIFGRRRIGKTALVLHWGEKHSFYYSQAIEASEKIQVEQIAEDLRSLLPEDVSVSSWKELLSLLSLIREPVSIAIDELPYLVKTQPSLPSLLQRWLDHKRPKQVSLILLGSSQSMMHDLFLQSTSPLFERAHHVLHLGPLSYVHYCECVGLKPLEVETFMRFSLVGGIPKYFSWAKEASNLEELADVLFFSPNARLESEPDRLLKDEDIHGLQAKSILESVGRGAHRPAEIANRLNIPQTALSKPLQILLNTSLIKRELPFDESVRSTKRTLYRLADSALQFWYGVYSPHRSRWHLYSATEKKTLFHGHASGVLEESYRQQYPDAQRYWESHIEFDCVRHDPHDRKGLIVSEIKFSRLTQQERDALHSKIEAQFKQCQLAAKYRLSKIEILDVHDVLLKISSARTTTII